MGIERFIFGSDYPIMHPRVAMELVNVIEIDFKEKEYIFSKNILRILSMDKAI
jgi:predicted TIM-barrel fold metal-dependent hydrolase